MIHYLMLPFLMLLLVVFQITILDMLALRWISVEISLIVVIYAGFHLDAFKGGLLSLVIGFFLDCLTSAIFGLYSFLYVATFYLSIIAGGRVYADNPLFVTLFTGLCALLKGLAIILLYRFFFGADILYALWQVFIPQAIVLGLLGPVVFRFIHRFEAFFYAGDARTAR